MKIKNPALIESLETDTLTEDMGICMLELALDQEYDFDEIRAIQKMFNISVINIVKEPTRYDEEGYTIESEEVSLSSEKINANDEKCLRFINELEPDNIARLSFYYGGKEFNTSALEKFKNLKIVDAIGYEGFQSFRLELDNNELIKFTGGGDILSYVAKLDSNKPQISLKDLKDIEKARIAGNKSISKILPQLSSINSLKSISGPTSITLEDIETLKETNIEFDTKYPLAISIKDVSELSPEKFKELSSNPNLPIQKIQIYSETNNMHQNQPYDFNTYSAIYGELTKLVDGIDDNLPEKEKFAEIYKRVTTSIAYDTPAAYPQTPEEEKYERDNVVDCRNLKNGLLYGKCVCAGYADILRNALALKGIEAQYISGPIDTEIDINLLNTSRYKNTIVQSRDESTGKAIIREYHAWNKVKLDGKWYNTDPTWDRDALLHDGTPSFALKSDEEFRKQGRTEIIGHDCHETMDQNELKDMFYGKHIRIGKFEVPNLKECKKYIKEYIDDIKSIPNDIKGSFSTFSNKLKNIFNGTKSLSDGSENKSDPHTDSEPKKELSSWDLENWGTDRNQFNEQRNATVNEFIKNTQEKNSNEQDKNTEIDGRE